MFVHHCYLLLFINFAFADMPFFPTERFKYGRLGSNKLVQGVCNYLQHTRKSHTKPYPIPVGGSNAIGTWGYINGVNELMEQIEQIRASHDDSNNNDFVLDHVIFATGSGGTATGIAVGLSLAYGSIGDGHALKSSCKVGMRYGMNDMPN